MGGWIRGRMACRSGSSRAGWTQRYRRRLAGSAAAGRVVTAVDSTPSVLSRLGAAADWLRPDVPTAPSPGKDCLTGPTRGPPDWDRSPEDRGDRRLPTWATTLSIPQYWCRRCSAAPGLAFG